MTTDEDLGFPADDAKHATDCLRDSIQSCLFDFDLPVVITAITQVFFGTLYSAGLGEKYTKKWLKKIPTLNEKPSKRSVRTATLIISSPTNKLIVNDNTNPYAVAFSLAVALTSIMRQLPIVTDDMANNFMAGLVVHINEAKAN